MVPETGVEPACRIRGTRPSSMRAPSHNMIRHCKLYFCGDGNPVANGSCRVATGFVGDLTRRFRDGPGDGEGGAMNAPPTLQERRLCGRCLNCRNGYPWLCLTRPRMKRMPHPVPVSPIGKRCNQCSQPVPKGRRLCEECRVERRRATWHESQNRRRLAHARKKLRKPLPGRVGQGTGDDQGAQAVGVPSRITVDITGPPCGIIAVNGSGALSPTPCSSETNPDCISQAQKGQP